MGFKNQHIKKAMVQMKKKETAALNRFRSDPRNWKGTPGHDAPLKEGSDLLEDMGDLI